MAAGSALVMALVMGLLLVALLRRRPARERPSAERLMIVLGGLLLPTLVLAALLVHGTGIGERLLDGDTAPLRVEVTGHQWWWQVRYPDAGVVTANEIAVPVGRTVEIVVTSADVIHSFWVPQLGGKIDMIPGRDNRVRLAAHAPGTFRGQCSEFCGAQHAHMALHVTALENRAFDAWLRTRAQPAATMPPAPFFAHGCDECHAVRGSHATGDQGPDLTHLGARSHIAAGLLANTQANRVRWIRGNQRLKPGNRMRAFADMPEADAEAIAGWLGTLE